MKRILPVLLVMMLFLTACGSQETVKTKEELKAEIMAELKAEAEKNTNPQEDNQSEGNENSNEQEGNAVPEYLSSHKVLEYKISDNQLYIKMDGTYENIEGTIFLSELSGEFEFMMDNKYKDTMESITHTDGTSGYEYKITPPDGSIVINEEYLSSVLSDNMVEKIRLGEEVKVTCNIRDYSRTDRFGSVYVAKADIEIVDFEKLASDNTDNNSEPPKSIGGHKVLEYSLTNDTFYVKLAGKYEGLVGSLAYDDYYESYVVDVSSLPGMVSHNFTLGGESRTIIPPTGTYLVDENYLKSVIGNEGIQYIKSGKLIKIDCNISDYTYSGKWGSESGTDGKVEIFDYELPAN